MCMANMKAFVCIAVVAVAMATDEVFEEASCSGSADPSAGVCYQAQELGETVKVDLKSYASGNGKLSITGVGLIGFTCADHQFTKSGQDISADLSDCLPDGVTLESVKYCSDSDTVAVTVKDKAVPLPIKTTAKKVACGVEEGAACTGSADPSAGVCYQAQELGETVKVDLKSYASGAGKLSITGVGLIGFTCADHQFTKSGQDIAADLSDCLPDGITLESVKYCSDSDSVAVTVKDKKVPLPIKTTATKVSCGKDVMMVV